MLSLKEAQRQLQKTQQEVREKDELIRSLNAKLAQVPAQPTNQTRGDTRTAQLNDPSADAKKLESQ